MKKDHGVLPI